MSQRVISGILAIACVALAFSLWNASQQGTRVTTLSTVPSMDFLQKSTAEIPMERPIDNLVLNKVPLEEAIRILAKQSGKNICVNWTELFGTNVSKQTPVDCMVHDVSLREALHAMLADLPPGDATPLDFYSADGIITITTARDANSHVEKAFLNIGPLVDAVMAKQDAISKDAIDSIPPAPETQSTANLFGGSDNTRTRSDVIDQITKIIAGTVAPESWSNGIGTFGTISQFDSMLIVTQSPENIIAIKDLLRTVYLAYTMPDFDLAGHAAARPSWSAGLSDSLLDRRIPAVDFAATQLEKAVEELARITHVNLCVRWKSMVDTGINPTTPVTIHLHDVTLGQVISHLGDAITDPPVNVYAASDGEIVTLSMVPSSQAPEAQFVTVFYDARTLIADAMKSSGGTASNRITSAEVVDRLIKISTDSVEPPSLNIPPWEKEFPRFQELGGVVVITSSSPTIVKKIVETLDHLHQTILRGDALPPVK